MKSVHEDIISLKRGKERLAQIAFKMRTNMQRKKNEWDMKMGAPYHGSCQCGDIRYVVKAEPVTLYICHCKECQKQTASAFAMSLTVRADQFEITQGLLKEWTRPAASGASVFCRFCAVCGTRIVHGKNTRPEYINIKPGTLDDTSWLRPVAQIWTSRAQSWVKLGPHILSYLQQPNDSAEMWSKWQEEHQSRLMTEQQITRAGSENGFDHLMG